MFGLLFNLCANFETKSNGPTEIELKSKGVDTFVKYFLLPTSVYNNKPNM